jgi:transcriptional regulator with XRE-family HTH domain
MHTSSGESPSTQCGELQQTVGRNVRAVRRQRGLSQSALAEELGVHRTYMGGVERGERNLTLRSLERIAATLGLDPRDLLGHRGDGD